MATADESMLHKSLDTSIFVSTPLVKVVMLCSHGSKVLNSETPGWPYEVVFTSFKVFANNGTAQISSTSRWRLLDHDAHIAVVSCGNKAVFG
jgi:hypothetical protein